LEEVWKVRLRAVASQCRNAHSWFFGDLWSDRSRYDTMTLKQTRAALHDESSHIPRRDWTRWRAF
jgi:hypothetical protein